MKGKLTAALAMLVMVACGRDGGITEPTTPASLTPPSGFSALGTDPVTGASIETNQDDYSPGEVVHVVGRGWAPGDTVNLHMTEEPNTHADVDTNVVADTAGGFSIHYYDVQVHDIGVTFTLAATGAISGSRAVATFTDGNYTIRRNGASDFNTRILKWNGDITCSGAANDSTGNQTVTTTSGPTIGQNAGSVRFRAPLNVGGVPFSSWSSSPAVSGTASDDGTLTYFCVPASLVATTFTITANYAATSVTINQAAGQSDPTNASPINFTAVFSANVTGFTGSDVTLSGTAGATTALVTGSGTTYNVAVSGMTGNGTVIATIAANVVDGGGNSASTSTDNTVTYDGTQPSVTINQAAGQADPTNASPINFTVVFSESVTGFATGDVTLGGTAGATTGTVTGSGTTYNVAVSGMTGAGTVIATIAANVAVDGVNNGNSASTSTDNTVTYDNTEPSVTINQAAGQVDPTNTSPINFTVVFSESVTGFETGDVTLSGTAGATTATVTGGGTTYNVAVSGMTSDGTVIASIPANAATDGAGNGNTPSTSTDNTVTNDGTPPTVTINQTAGQVDPTNTSPINFTVVFSESVTGFVTGDVTLSGTAGATTATVTGTGTTYNVAVSGMASEGTVIATILADQADDAAGNGNTASTSTDNSVTYDNTDPSVTIDQAAAQADPTNASPINFIVVFSESVTGFATGDVTLSGTAGANTATVTGSGTTYKVAVSGMTGTGTVIATIAANKANDAASNGNTASTSTDHTVTYDNGGPVTSNVVANPSLVAINTSFQLTAKVDDSGTGNANIASAEYNIDGGGWIGGGSATPAYNTSPTVNVSWTVTITTTGVYNVCVRGQDAGGNYGEPTCILLAVFDPNDGFVVGGGWITSPAGAYLQDPSLFGKATFGFVSKYLRGTTTPSGKTEFQFHAGSLNFKSTSYDWLVIAGARAQFKGSGTINGGGDYGFLLTAVDAQVAGGGPSDRFRIKIINKTTGDVVYDNQIGGDDNASLSTVLGGGSIVIQSR